MATKAKSIAAADLTTFTKAAVKAVAVNGKFVKGPLIWGFVSPEDIGAAKLLEQATAITGQLATTAKAGGVAGLKAVPAVVYRPGKILAGYIDRELSHEIAGL